MVDLLTKNEIQSLNIDTVEKALVFGALVLRSALVGSDNSNAESLNVSINLSAVSDSEGNLNLEIYLPYSAYQLNTKGGQLLDAVGEYSSNAPNLLLDLSLESLPTSSPLVIPDYNEALITTVEKYLVYYAQILWASVANKRANAIALTFLGNQDLPQLLISVNLPLNLDTWLLGRNYLDSISNVATSYITPPNSGGNQLPGNLGIYFYHIDNPASDTEYIIHTVTVPGTLLGFTVEAPFQYDYNFYELVFLVNGETISYEDAFDDFTEQIYEFSFDSINNPILLNVGDTIGFKSLSFDSVAYIDINAYIEESGGGVG